MTVSQKLDSNVIFKLQLYRYSRKQAIDFITAVNAYSRGHCTSFFKLIAIIVSVCYGWLKSYLTFTPDVINIFHTPQIIKPKTMVHLSYHEDYLVLGSNVCALNIRTLY